MRPLALSLFLVLGATGCRGIAYDRRALAPPPPPPPGVMAQYCTSNGTTDLYEANAFLAEQAQKGWILTAIGGQMASVYCFRYEGIRP
jgi:hypothetical protein